MRPLLSRLGWVDRVDGVVISCEVGAEKPDPRIFDAALGALGPGLRAQETVVIGDEPENDREGGRRWGGEGWLWGEDVKARLAQCVFDFSRTLPTLPFRVDARASQLFLCVGGFHWGHYRIISGITCSRIGASPSAPFPSLPPLMVISRPFPRWRSVCCGNSDGALAS